MTWFLITVLAFVAVGAVLTLLLLIVVGARMNDDTEAEQARIDAEVRRAERRLHDIARDSFTSMLDEARTLGHRGVR